jgi:V/A-type H+-transporting ATPase subunit I
MQKLELVGLRNDRDALLRELQLLGCLELTPIESKQEEEGAASTAVMQRTPDEDAVYFRLTTSINNAKHALKLLDKYAHVKSPMFAPLPLAELDELFDSELSAKTEPVLERFLAAENALTQAYSELARLDAAKTSLLPWETLDVPLQMGDTHAVLAQFGGVTTNKDIDEFKTKLNELKGLATLYLAGSDKNQQYALVVAHRNVGEEANALLREYGFNRSHFALKGTARDNIAVLDGQIDDANEKIKVLLEELKEFGEYRDDIKLYCDQLTQFIAAEDAKRQLVNTEKAFAMTGWVPLPEVERLRELLTRYTAAYELRDPVDDEAVPIKLRNNKVTEPLNMVTEMYSLPLYTNIDPNPLIMPFFVLFFGIMFADFGYGALLIITSLIVQKKSPRMRGTMGQMMRLMLQCGISTCIVGLVTGSMFGNAWETVAGFFGVVSKMPQLFDPLSSAMMMLIASLIIGVIQILVGMGIKAYLLIRDGKPLDALFDVGSWWLLFAGIGVLALGITPYVALAGVAALVLTQGRKKPTIGGKIIGGVASLYDITSYFGDILSYSRLMALMLTGGVLANVFNMLGAMGGPIMFVPVFIVGHLLNIGLNIIGTYVHSARLQYLEYFGKFYEDGGKPFKPLAIRTKYVDIA